MSTRELLAKAGMELLWWREEHPCCGGKSDALLVEMNAALTDVPVDIESELREALARADREAKGWETNRKGTTENGQRYVRDDIVHAALRQIYLAGRDVSAAVHDARVTELLLANNAEVERRRDAEMPSRPMETAPRDGTVIRLLMGREQPVTVGWWVNLPPSKGIFYPWQFIDTSRPGEHFLNRAVESLPIAWGRL